MQISKIHIAKLAIPLIRPFITALRQTDKVEDIVVIIEASTGLRGYGAAAATPAITGDSSEGIIGALSLLAPRLLHQELANFEQLLLVINQSLVNNTSAKAALDMAVHDLVSQSLSIPLYKFFGSKRNSCQILTTVSVKSISEMVADAQLFVSQGFTTLKLKVGVNPEQDLARIKAVRQAIGPAIDLIIDANQGWEFKSALMIIKQLEQAQLNIAMVEQPLKAWDYANLKLLREQSPLPIFADESVFSVRDALQIISNGSADWLNLKLMKSGGLYAARTIYELATAHAVPCMAGCMLESPIGLTAMASLVVGRTNIRFIDLDPITMLQTNPVSGGISRNGASLTLSDAPGLGISAVSGLQPVTSFA